MRRRRKWAPADICPVTLTSGEGSDYTADEIAFAAAVNAYRKLCSRPFPSWSEVLAIAVALGYRRVADPAPLPRFRSKLGPTRGLSGDLD